MVETEFREESLMIAQTLKLHVQNRGITLAQFATAWVLANRTISSVIAGPRTLTQWTDYAPALDFQLTAEDEELTPTMKLKRAALTERVRGVIDGLYPGARP